MDKKIFVVIPHSHTWFWTQTCLAALARNPPRTSYADVYVVVVDNSPWSPAIRGVTDTDLVVKLGTYCHVNVIPNHKTNRFHASALDCVVEDYDFDYMMALETDVLMLSEDWLDWFLGLMKPTDFAVGHWHHEGFLNPSCTLYRGSVLRSMEYWCRTKAPRDELRWGPMFTNSAPLDTNLKLAENPVRILDELVGWIGAPFAEKRGWPAGTTLKEPPSGQFKGPGWYEPGQQLYHWAINEGHTCTVAPTLTTEVNGIPVQTLYGPVISDPSHQLEAAELHNNARAAHLWGGTRALDIIKHAVNDPAIRDNTPTWLAREARFWRDTVPPNVQAQTLELIRKYGWHYTGQGSDHVSDRDREAAEFVRACYKEGGVEW